MAIIGHINNIDIEKRVSKIHGEIHRYVLKIKNGHIFIERDQNETNNMGEEVWARTSMLRRKEIPISILYWAMKLLIKWKLEIPEYYTDGDMKRLQ
jgi:hypothetical protein